MYLRKSSIIHSLKRVLLAGFCLFFLGLQNPQEAKAQVSVAYMGDARPSKFGSSGITELTKDFNQVVAQSPTGNVGAIFLLGDFDRAISQTMVAFNASTAKNIPLYFVIGNHEVEEGDVPGIRARFGSSPISLNAGPAGTDKTTYSLNVGNMHIVNINEYWNGTNNDAYFKYGSGDGGYIPDALQNWINADLANASNPACMVTMGHDPLYPYNRHVGDSLDEDTANRNRLQNSFVANKVGVFFGAHTHTAVVTDHGGIWHVDTGVSGKKSEDTNGDKYASIFYTHINSSNQMILTWKHDNGNSWSSPTAKTYTAQCDTGGPTGSPTPTPSGTLTPTPSGTPTITPTPSPCTPTKTCADYDGYCGANLFDGCTNSLNCGSNCSSPEVCSPSGLCIYPPPSCGNLVGGLVPCGRKCDDPKTTLWNETDPCTFCHLFLMSQLVIEFLVRLAGAAAMIAIAIGGLLYVFAAGSSETINKAKSMIKYTLIGFTIIFIAWAIVDSVLASTGFIDPMGGKWYTMGCSFASGPTPGPSPSPTPGPSPSPTPSVSPTPSPSPGNCPTFPVYGPTPGSFSTACTHTLTVAGTTVTAKDPSGAVVSTGNFNKVLGDTAKSGNHVCIQDGNYTLNSISLPEKVFIECLPGAGNVKPHIQILPTVNYLIYLKSDSSIKGCAFEFVNGTGTTIYANGDVKNWSVENNHFINTHDAVLVKNDNASNPPTNGYGSVLNNTGLHSKLGSLQGSRYVTFKDNKFYDRSGDEFFDFNGKNGAYDGVNAPNFENTLENNILENVNSGYFLNDEAIDMIGNNNNNVVRNNRIIGNFQKGIGPRYEASGNCIEGNYIEFKSGINGSAHGITLWDHTSNASRFPANNKILNNTIVGNIVGISLKGAKNNIVTGNSINATQCGISVSSDSTGNTVSGNIFLNPAIPQTCN